MTLQSPPVIPADDRGFLLGDGLFETIRLYHGRPFRLEAHLERLEAGASRVGIPVPVTLRERIREARDQWKGEDGALRITLTRGSGPGLLPPGDLRPTLAVQIRSWAPDPRWYDEGLSASLAGRVDPGALTAGLKRIGYLEPIQALRTARAGGADEALLTDGQGRVVEGSASNLLVLVDDGLLAPGAEQGALAGVTRREVLAILREEGRRIQERAVDPEELKGAQEVLLTSSLREIVPVVRVEGRPVGGGAPGPLARTLLLRYREQVARAAG